MSLKTSYIKTLIKENNIKVIKKFKLNNYKYGCIIKINNQKYFLKIGYSIFNKIKFYNEISGYKEFKNKKFLYPKIIKYAFTDDVSYILFEYIENLRKAFNYFSINAYSNFKNNRTSLKNYLIGLKNNYKKHDQIINRIIYKKKFNLNDMILTCKSHGDFVFSNVLFKNGYQYIIDFEEFKNNRIYLYDFIHWYLQPIIQFMIKRFNINVCIFIINIFLVFFKKFLCFKFKLRFEDADIYLKLYFLERNLLFKNEIFNFPKSKQLNYELKMKFIILINRLYEFE